MYKKIDNNDIAYLKTIFSPSMILVGDEIGHDYGKDELGTVQNMPEVVVFATCAEEISKVMKYANESYLRT